MKQILATIFLAVSASVAHADLRYTTHVEVRMTSVSTTGNPAFTQIATLLQGIVPSGGMRTYLSADAARIEPAAGSAGPVILFREDGEVVLDPAARTYWRMSALREVLVNKSAPQPTFRRTGEFTTIMGQQAERVLFTTSIPLPLTPPAGFPSMLTMEGELWVANAHAYTKSLSRLADLAGPTASRLQGLVLRQILRNAQFGYEVEYSVTEVEESPVAAALFEIPADYREVSLPVALAAPKF